MKMKVEENLIKKYTKEWYDGLSAEENFIYSRCHYIELVVLPIYWVQSDGSEKWMGRVFFCGWNEWENNRRSYCGKIRHLRYKKHLWPASLNPKNIPELFPDGPGYWLSAGFHFLQYKDSWINMRSNSYLPMDEDYKILIPEAKKVVDFRKAHPNPDGFKIDSSLFVKKEKTQVDYLDEIPF